MGRRDQEIVESLLKYNAYVVMLNEIARYFEHNPTKNKVYLRGYTSLDDFDEEYAMNLDIGKPYIIKKLYGEHGAYLEVTRREEYSPELYY